MPPPTSGPVSYTHLDVYKRQVFEVPEAEVEWVRHEVPRLMAGVAPVSYTHLDVYKRQINSCWRNEYKRPGWFL